MRRHDFSEFGLLPIEEKPQQQRRVTSVEDLRARERQMIGIAAARRKRQALLRESRPGQAKGHIVFPKLMDVIAQ